MQNFKYVLSNQTLYCRFFSTSLPRLGQRPYKTVDEVLNFRGPRFMIFPHKRLAKMLFMKKSKPSAFSRPPVGQPSICVQTAASSVTPSYVASSKRVHVLNKLFMRYIPEILATSEIGIKLYGHDVQFTHVQTSADYKYVKVFWIPKGTEKDDVVQKLLDEVAAPLRHEFSAMRVMGIIPQILFRKNKFHALMAEVDRRLKIADFGEDFVPTVFTEDILKRQLQLQTTIPIEVKGNLMQFENEEPIQEDEKVKIAPMKMDTFGLNYNLIQKTIVMGMKNKRIAKLALADEKSLLGASAITEVPLNIEVMNTAPLDKKSFLAYIRKTKSERKKMLKEQRKEFQRQALLTASMYQDSVDDVQDELYNEFVKNAFEDYVEEFDDNQVRQEL